MKATYRCESCGHETDYVTQDYSSFTTKCEKCGNDCKHTVVELEQ